MTGLFIAVQMLYWAVYSMVLSYVSVYLLGSGFSNSVEGAIVAVAALVAALLQPVLASRTDRLGGKAVKKALIAMTCVFLVFDALLLILGQGTGLAHLAVGGLYGAELMLSQLMTPFVFSLGTVSERAGKKVNFGLARGCGSAMYSLSALICGRAVGKVGIQFIPGISIPIYAALLILLIIFPFPNVKGGNDGESDVRSSSGLAFFKKYQVYTQVLIGAVCLYTTHMLVNTFGFQIVAAKGGGSPELGVGTALAAMTEIPIMIIFGRLKEKIVPEKWLVICGIFYIVRAVGYLALGSVSGYYAMQFLQMFSWAVIAIVSVFYASSVMEPQDEVKGQAYFTMALSVGNVIAALLGGPLIDRFGVNAMLILALVTSVAGTGVIIHAVGRTFAERRMEAPMKE